MTPNTGFQIALSEVNTELVYPANTYIKMDDSIVRSLTGLTARQAQQSAIFMSNLQGKTAFGGIDSSLSTSQNGFGNVVATVAASVQSDMIGTSIDWSYAVNASTGFPNIILTPSGDGKTAAVSVYSNIEGNHSATITLTAAVSYNGHQLGTKDRTISFTTAVQNAAFIVSGTTTVNVAEFSAQTATTTLTASSNVAGAAIVFQVTPTVGTLVQGNTITFTRTAQLVGQDNAATYSLISQLISNTGQLIAQDNKTVNVRAAFLAPDLILTSPATVNNFFANSGPINSSITVTGSHGVPGANVVWSTETLSGDVASISVGGSTANVYLPVPGFGAKKSVTRLKASLEYANGYVLNNRYVDLTLRTVGYGLSHTPASNLSLQAYTSTTATADARASWQAGVFSWDISRLSTTAAVVTNSILASTATANISLTSDVGVTKTATYRINPVIKFDNIVVANVENVVSISATQDPYSFVINSTVSNTVISDEGAFVNSRGFANVSHNIPGGYVVWSRDNANVAITSNTSAATLTANTTNWTSETVTVSGTLFDSFNRLVETKTKAITLNAYRVYLSFSGDVDYSTPPGYTSPQITTGSIITNLTQLAPGAILNATAEKVSGSTLSVTNSGTDTRKTTTIRATASSNTSAAATVQGTYRVNAGITWNGASYNLYSNNSTITATLLGKNLVIAQQSSQNNTGFSSPVEATATIQVANNNVVGSNIVWNVPAGTTVVSQDNTTLVIKVSQSTIGSTVGTIPVTATAFVNGSAVVTSNQISADPVATLKSANLSLVGPTSNTQSAVFGSTAQIVLNATVDPTLTGHTFLWTITPVSGEAATISGSGASRTFSLTREGNGTAVSSYDVTVRVRLNGVDIATVGPRRISLSATAELPQIFFGSANAEISSYLPPVGATTIVNGYTIPAGVATTWTIDSGGASGTTSNATHFSITATTGADFIGTVTNQKTITATLRTPSGALIGNYTGTFKATATRKDPQFVLDVPATLTTKSWNDPIAIQADFVASVNAEIAGSVSYTFTNINTSGVSVTTPSANVRRVSRSTAGTSPVTTNSTVKCEVFLSGVKIGEQTKTVQMNTIPYYLTLTPATITGSGDPGGLEEGMGFTVLSSNHENFASTPITWSLTNDSVTINKYTSNEGGVNNRIDLLLTQGQGNRERSGTITATFFDGTTNRTKATSYYLFTFGYCLEESMWLDAGIQAKDAMVGMRFMTWLPESGYEVRPIEKVGKPVKQPGVELRTKSGAVLRCSRTTPFALETSKFDLDDSKLAPDMLGEKVMVDQFGMIYWDEVVAVIDIGEITTIPISFGGRNFAGGQDKNALIYSHNLKAT